MVWGHWKQECEVTHVVSSRSPHGLIHAIRKGSACTPVIDYSSLLHGWKFGLNINTGISWLYAHDH